MVSWVWVLVAALGGTVFGMFLFAFLEVSREDKEKEEFDDDQLESSCEE